MPHTAKKRSEFPRDFKGKLNWLIDNQRKPDGEKWSDREIADAIGATRGYVNKLRNDPSVNNPSLDIMKALGRFFNVSLRFFEDDFDPARTEDLFEAIMGSELAMRAPGIAQLSEEDKLAILRMIDNSISAAAAKKKKGG